MRLLRTSLAHGNRSRLLFVPALAVSLLAAVACGSDDPGNNAENPHPHGVPTTASPQSGDDGFRGGVVSPPFKKPGVVLTDTAGKPFDLVAETRGKLTLVYLGYTHCPDICPTHMLEVKETLKDLPPDLAAKYTVVFITVDPERDTPEVIGKWLNLFSRDFIGLTGTVDQINHVHDLLGMEHPVKTQLGDDQYAVSHAAFVFAYTADNVAPLVFPSGFSMADWKHDLEKLAREGWTED